MSSRGLLPTIIISLGEKEILSKRYLKYVREVPEFGSEYFNIRFCENDIQPTSKDYKEKTLIVNAKGLNLKLSDIDSIQIKWPKSE